MKNRPLALRITVILAAVVLMTAFVLHEHRSGERRHHFRTDHFRVDSPETVIQQQTSVQDSAWRMVRVKDQYGRGGKITLDSLQRRVEAGRIMLSGTKAPMPSWLDQRQEEYLDSLLRVHRPKP